MDVDLFGAFEGDQVVDHVDAAVSADAKPKRRTSQADKQSHSASKRSRVHSHDENPVQEEISKLICACKTVYVSVDGVVMVVLVGRHSATLHVRHGGAARRWRENCAGKADWRSQNVWCKRFF